MEAIHSSETSVLQEPHCFPSQKTAFFIITVISSILHKMSFFGTTSVLRHLWVRDACHNVRERYIFLKIACDLATPSILTLTRGFVCGADVDDQRWRVQPITPNIEVTSHLGLIFNQQLNLSVHTWSQRRVILNKPTSCGLKRVPILTT
jgi:hypothetical protein